MSKLKFLFCDNCDELFVTSIDYQIRTCQKCNAQNSLNEISEGVLSKLTQLTEKVMICENAHRWIPVSERLPEYRERVLFFGGGEMTTHIGYYVPELPQWTAEDGGYFHGKNEALITHWMPLPPPPEEK